MSDRWIPVVGSIFCLGIGAVATPELLPAWRNDGTPGTFTARAEECSGGRFSQCDWVGTFVSDDDSIRADDVSYNGPGIEEPGDATEAQATREHPAEVYRPGSRFWMLTLAMGIGGTAYLGYFVWSLVRRRRARRPIE